MRSLTGFNKKLQFFNLLFFFTLHFVHYLLVDGIIMQQCGVKLSLQMILFYACIVYNSHNVEEKIAPQIYQQILKVIKNYFIIRKNCNNNPFTAGKT